MIMIKLSLRKTKENLIMSITYYSNGKEVTKEEYASQKKYLKNPPEGYTRREIERMPDDHILDMDYFLNE